jgi:hypothetical protein
MQYHLGQLAVGEKAVITGFVDGQKEYRAKLLAMGLTKGIKPLSWWRRTDVFTEETSQNCCCR